MNSYKNDNCIFLKIGTGDPVIELDEENLISYELENISSKSRPDLHSHP